MPVYCYFFRLASCSDVVVSNAATITIDCIDGVVDIDDFMDDDGEDDYYYEDDDQDYYDNENDYDIDDDDDVYYYYRIFHIAIDGYANYEMTDFNSYYHFISVLLILPTL